MVLVLQGGEVAHHLLSFGAGHAEHIASKLLHCGVAGRGEAKHVPQQPNHLVLGEGESLVSYSLIGVLTNY